MVPTADAVTPVGAVTAAEGAVLSLPQAPASDATAKQAAAVSGRIAIRISGDFSRVVEETDSS